jgi:hypothetical protein
MKSRLAAPIYTWARKVSKKSGSFYASAQRMAAYFRLNRKTVLSAMDELVDNGFFQIDRVERFKPNVYKVLDHKEWAIAHPGHCVQELSFPWKGQGDPLGRQLYAISGGRAKFWPNQMTGLRNLGFSDEEIIKHFNHFLLETCPTGRQWKRVYYAFLDYLLVASRIAAASGASTVSNRTDTDRVQPNGPHRAHSKSATVSNRTDPILRSYSPNALDEVEPSIPAPSSRSAPGPKPSKPDNETLRALDDVLEKLNAPRPALTPPSEAEWERRKAHIKAQAEQLKRQNPDSFALTAEDKEHSELVAVP